MKHNNKKTDREGGGTENRPDKQLTGNKLNK